MHKIINLLKSSYHHNFKFLKTKITRREMDIVKIFLKLGIIGKIVKLENENFLIFFNYHKNTKVFFYIKNMYKPSRKTYIKYNTLLNVTKNKNYLLILSTSKGIINNVEAVKFRTGGMILAKIWN